jgi:hypothetical protein
MSRLLLIEDLDQQTIIEPADVVVALTAEAVEALTRIGRVHHVATDFGSEQRIAVLEAEHWERQMDWLRRLGDDITRLWPEPLLALNPTVAFGHHLKTMLDTVFVRAIEADGILSVINPDEVVFCAKRSPGSWPAPVISRSLSDGTVNRALWPLMCQSRSIPYRQASDPVSSTSRRSEVGIARTVARQAQQKLQLARFWTTATTRRASGSALTLLFLHEGNHLRSLISEAMAAGHRCLLWQGPRLTDLQNPTQSEILVPRTFPNFDEGAWHRAIDQILAPESRLWQWPSSWCGVSMAPILSGPLRGWLQRLPESAGYAAAFAEYYDRQKVDYVATFYVETEDQIEAVAATALSKATESILFNDGDCPDRAFAWDLRNLLPFDHFVTNDLESATYYRERAATYAKGQAAEVHITADRWELARKLRQKPVAYVERWDGGLPVKIRRPPGRVPLDKPILVYVSAEPECDYRYVNKPSYNEAWYQRFQQDLVRALADFPSYSIVVKFYPYADLKSHPTSRFIATLGASNIYVSKAPYVLWVPWAARVVMDKPSTTLFQTALAGVPFHLLAHKSLAMRPSALAPFAGSMTEFETTPEAVNAVTRFLSGPPGGPVTLGQPSGRWIDTIGGFGGGVRRHGESGNVGRRSA